MKKENRQALKTIFTLAALAVLLLLSTSCQSTICEPCQDQDQDQDQELEPNIFQVSNVLIFDNDKFTEYSSQDIFQSFTNDSINVGNMILNLQDSVLALNNYSEYVNLKGVNSISYK